MACPSPIEYTDKVVQKIGNTMIIDALKLAPPMAFSGSEPPHTPHSDPAQTSEPTLLLSDPELEQIVRAPERNHSVSQPDGPLARSDASSDLTLMTLADAPHALEASTTPMATGGHSASSPRQEDTHTELSLKTPTSRRGETGAHLKLGDRFALLGLIGFGGMGNVYRAYDHELEEVVALKMLRHERISAAGVLKRFRQEVRLARKITHPNIARMYDIGEVDGERFLTMEYIDGETLAHRLARQLSLSVVATLGIGIQLCLGLEAAHRAGVVHRDLKPDNILISKDNRVAITDFGIAWPLAEATSGKGERHAGLAGTPTYMAPEQIQGRPLDPRTDLYALGLILFEMLSGKPVWTAEGLTELLVVRLHRDPPSLEQLCPEVPATLTALIQQLLQLEPEQRPASAAAVGRSLQGIQHDVDQALTARQAASKQYQPEPAQGPITRIPTLAVLPFQNQGAPEAAWLAEGITEDLIDTLSMLPSVRVRPRSMTRSLTDYSGDIRELGRTLDVTSILQGTVRRIGERVRVTARMTCTTDGIQLRTVRLERAIEDTLIMAEALAQELSSAFSGEMLPPTRTQPTNPKAIELYLRARKEYMKAWGEYNQIALELFSEAHALAPEDPLIMSGYAMSLARRYGQGAVIEGQDALARELAERALARVPNLGEARMALAWLNLHMGYLPQTGAQVRLALKAAPGLADPYELAGRLLTEAGDTERGLQMFETALMLDPTQQHILSSQARTRALAGQVKEALAILDGMPELPELQGFKWTNIARITGWHRLSSRVPEIIERLKPQTFHLAPVVIEMLRLYGAREIPSPVMNYLVDFATNPKSTARMRALGCQLVLEAHAQVYQFDECWPWLAVADKEQLLDLHWLEHCPLLQPLRTDPRWSAIHPRVQTRALQTIRAFDGH